jgi:dienelactone hydrolase
MLFRLVILITAISNVRMKAKPHGSWKSPITSSMIVDEAIKLGDIVIDEGVLYWNEIRPMEQGRSVIMKWKEGKVEDVLPQPYNARSRVHEYGGASFTINSGTIYFSNFKDQHFYSLSPAGEVSDLSQTDGKRYANPIVDPERDFLYAVQEEHRSEHDVINTLVKIDPKEKKIDVIHEGWDFYGMPTLHPKGTHLAFITWNHPNMPWDGSTLWVGELCPDGSLINLKEVAGGISESIFQPQWSNDGTLYFVSDRTGFWNLYREGEKEIEPCYPMEAEFGQPLWVFGMSRFGFLPNGKIACIYTVKGTDALGILDPDAKKLETLDLPFTTLSHLQVHGNTLYFIGASPVEVSSLIRYDFKTVERIRISKKLSLDPSYISIPETIEFPTENGNMAFGFFYPPKNKDFKGTDQPPLIVKSHGGPSAHVTSSLNLEIQFWTSRGIAFFDVNYGGSTGYGRKYRQRLKGNWGIVDIDDCTNGALYLAKLGKVDPKKMVIKGGSAGGYTTLAALTFKDVFKAGASYYGVSDLEALTQDTHKFESHYLEGLIGPYPEQKERYKKCSPIHHTDKLSCPVILFQGAEDKVVPPSQSEILFDALKKKKIPVAYLLFEKEQHGFRIAENIKKSLDAELYFYSKIFGFEPSDVLEPITIHNLP